MPLPLLSNQAQLTPVSIPLPPACLPACVRSHHTLPTAPRAREQVWVLTGDKVETAISIAYSCQLFTDAKGLVEFREAEFGRGKDAAAHEQVRRAAAAGAASAAACTARVLLRLRRRARVPATCMHG